MEKPAGNPVKWILLGCGALAGLAVLCAVGIGLLWWHFSSPAPKPSAAGGNPDAATVTLPPGAVDHDVKVEIKAESAPVSLSDSTVKVVGKVWSVRIDGQDHFTFKKPVRVSVPFDRSVVKAGAPVALSRWENFHWNRLEGSRVEGDRVVADVDHFSDVAPTQDDGRPPSLLDADSWYVTIDLNISGSESGATEISSYSWGRSREASVSFRVPTRIPTYGDQCSWVTPFGAAAAEDQTRYHFSVNDGGYITDDDYDRNGNVYHHRTVTGSGGGHTFVANKLDIDLRKGTYSLSGSARVGKVVTKAWSTWGDTSVKTSEEPVSVSYTLKRKLPATQGTLTDTFDIPPQEFGSRLGPLTGWGKEDHGSMTVTLTPGPPALSARILGPHVVRRVDQVPLDGTTSTGDIVEYFWKFTVAGSCPVEGGRVTELRGPTVSFHALWDFEAELTVKDRAGKTASTTRTIKVLPREGIDWITKDASKTGPLEAAMRAGVKDLENSKDPKRTLPSGAPLAGGIQIGINQCVPHPQTFVSGHQLHTTDPANKSWSDGGYELQRVGDDGPFRGLFFVSKQSLFIDRIERVNTLLSNYSSDLYPLNRRHGTEPNVVALFKQAKEHERLHSALAKDELLRLRKDRMDPAQLLEKVIGLQLDSTKRDADESAAKSHLKLLLASNEAKVKEALKKTGKYNAVITIWLPMIFDDNGQKSTIEVDVKLGELWNIGDE